MTEQKTQNQDKFIIRLPEGLRERIRLAADNNNRSMNAEVVALLEEKYPQPRPEKISDPAAKILFWLAARIRRRKPKPGSLREKQANLYEAVAADLEARMETAEGQTR